MNAEQWYEHAARLRAKIMAMQAWRERPFYQIALDWPCSQCGAKVNELCRSPNGLTYTRDSAFTRRYYPERVTPSVHRPRGTLAAKTANDAPTWLGQDLDDWGRLMGSGGSFPFAKQLMRALTYVDRSLLGKHLQARGEWPA